MSRHATTAALLACIALFVGARVALAVRAQTQLYQPEEYINLRLAASLLGEDGAWGPLPRPVFPGPRMGSPVTVPLLDAFQYQDFDGGTLAVAMLLVPVAAVFGLGQITMKLGALLWALAILLLWLEVLGHAGGPRGAAWGAAAFAFGPAPWLLLGAIHWGNHAESAFGPPLILLAGLAARRSLGWGRWPAFLGLGAVAGFAVWFSQLNLLPGAVALLGALVVARARPWHLLPVAAGVCAGLAPRAIRVGWEGVFRFGAQKLDASGLIAPLLDGAITGPELLDVYAREPALATWRLGGLGSSFGGPPLELALRLVVAVALLAAVVGAARRKDGRWLVLSVCAVVAATWAVQPALLAAAFELLPRRVANLYPLLCAAVGLGCAALARWQTWAGALLLLAWAAPNAAGQAVLLSHADPPNAPLTPWAWYSPPTAAVWDRVPGGLPTIDPDLVQAVQDELAVFYAAPGPEANELAGGFFAAFGQERTGLKHTRLACQPPPGVPPPGPRAARGFAQGLRVRCRDEAPDPAWCEVVSAEDRPICEAAVR